MQDIIDYIRQLRIEYMEYFSVLGAKHVKDVALSHHEDSLGKIALVAIQELIKIQHIKNGGSKHDPIMRMDGNADNYHELDFTLNSPATRYLDENEFDRLLVKTAGKLLRYGS